MKIAIASDHGGVGLKSVLIKHLSDKNIDYVDCCRLVQNGEATYAVLVCGTGIGMCIAANKMKGIRAALCGDEFSAHFTRAHNDANVLTLGARVIGPGLAESILDTFLSSEFEGGRHARRLEKIKKIENEEL